MYKTKHKPLRGTLNSLSAALNAILLMVFFYVLALNVNFWKAASIEPFFICHLHYIPLNNQPPLVINIKEDKVSLEIPSEVLREQILKDIGGLYNIDFSDEEKAAFKQNGIVGVPLSDFKTRIFDHYLDNRGSEIPGIPCQTGSTELFDWVKQARIADVAINQLALTITIKADHNASNNILKQVEATLLKQQVQWFNLVTDTSNMLLHFDDNGKLLSAENNSAKKYQIH